METNNSIAVFSNPDFGEVRTVETNGEPWFVGKEIAAALGYQNGSRDIDRHVDEDDKATVAIHDAIRAHCRYTVKRSIPHPQSHIKPSVSMLMKRTER